MAAAKAKDKHKKKQGKSLKKARWMAKDNSEDEEEAGLSKKK